MRRKSENFHSTTSCRYLIQMHLIFVVKYRKHLLCGSLNDDMICNLKDIATKYDFQIKTLNSDLNHLHMLIDIKPSVSVSQIVRVLKQESTVFIWRKYAPILRNHFWKERTFWSDGYFVASIGNANEQTIQKYIEQQGSEKNIYCRFMAITEDDCLFSAKEL